MLDPTAFYACINILHFLTKGGLKGAIGRPKSFMLGPCWRYVGSFFALGRFLDVFCASCCVLLALVAVFMAFWYALGSIFKGLGLSKEGFGASWTLLFATVVFVWPTKCMNCCRKPKLAFASAFRAPLQRGGTCAAHGIGVKLAILAPKNSWTAPFEAS